MDADGSALGRKHMKYIDRKGNITIENSKQDKLLYWMYNSIIGRKVLKLLIKPGISRAAGWLLEQRCSKLFIAPFIRKNQIDMSFYEEKEYLSYNDFFTRQIRKEFRPVAEGEETFISPCDGKLSIYPIEDNRHFCIKNTDYTLESLLRSRGLAEKYQGGYICVFRLTVDDYHRFCYVDDGRKSANHHIPGVFHTVNPAANDVCPIYKENTREYSLLKSRHFKTILMMEVGALLVGRIVNYQEEAMVTRGAEKGKFEFGGSTVILLVQKDAVEFDKDILENTQKGYETIVKIGERIGTAKR